MQHMKLRSRQQTRHTQPPDPDRPSLNGRVSWSQRHGGIAAKATSFGMTTPFVVLFLAFFALPFVYAIVQSLSSPNGTGGLGLGDYKTVVQTGTFWSSIARVAFIGVIQIIVMLGLAMTLALFLDSPYCKGKRFFALVFFLPYAIPGVVASIMWGFLLSPSTDNLLHGANIDPLTGNLLIYSIILIVLWEFTGYNMTIYLTGLASIPPEVLASARVDGCSEWQIALRIKLPLLRRMVIFTAVLSIIGTLQLFNEPQILSAITNISPTFTPNLAIYNQAFAFSNIPFAAAESIILGAVILAATIAFFTLTRERSGTRRIGPATQAGGRPRPGQPASALSSVSATSGAEGKEELL